jgi:hypothetical protein
MGTFVDLQARRNKRRDTLTRRDKQTMLDAIERCQDALDDVSGYLLAKPCRFVELQELVHSLTRAAGGLVGAHIRAQVTHT